MAATLTEIFDGIEGLLTAIPDLRVTDVVGPDLPVSGNASVAVVMAPAIESYRATMRRGVYEMQVGILVLTSTAVDRVGQRKMLDYASQTGPKSIRAAVEADETLGGTCQTSYLESFRPLGIEEVGVINYFGGLFTIHLAASGA